MDGVFKRPCLCHLAVLGMMGAELGSWNVVSSHDGFGGKCVPAPIVVEELVEDIFEVVK